MESRRWNLTRWPALRALEILLIAGGAALVLVWASVTLWGWGAGKLDVHRLEASLALPDQSLWSAERRAAYLESLGSAAAPPLGIMRISRIGIEAAVYEGVSELNLNRGVSRIEGTALPDEEDNLGIAGHRDGYFRALRDIAQGDLIELDTRLGARRYRVTETLIVEPEDVWVLDPEDTATLTLVTCYPFYFVGSAPQRFIVRALAEPAVTTKRAGGAG